MGEKWGQVNVITSEPTNFDITSEYISSNNDFYKFSFDMRYFYENYGIGILIGTSILQGNRIYYKRPEDSGKGKDTPVYLLIHTWWYPILLNEFYNIVTHNNISITFSIGPGFYRLRTYGKMVEKKEVSSEDYKVDDVDNYRNNYFGIHGALEMSINYSEKSSLIIGMREYNIYLSEEWMPGLEIYIGWQFK